ncbi:EamA family transporter [Trebonia sp.]|uniref:EamA family transporter n=1 Tax=Trebonia sp. TaxID=2767075 RepID=UPI003CC59355
MSSVRALDDQPGSGGTLDTVTREAAGAPGVQASPVRSGRGTGLVIGLLSAAAFGTSGTFGTSLIGAGWSPAGAVLARVSIAALVLTGPALVQLRGRWTLLRRWGWRTVAYGCVGVAACQLGYFNAISRMPVGIALLIEYMGILLVVGWLWVRHGQRPRRLTIAGSAAAIGGLALMLDLSGPGGISPVGVLWALLAAVSMAVYFILSAWSGTQSPDAGPTGTSSSGAPSSGTEALPPVVMTWGGMIVGAVVLAAAGVTGLAPLAASSADVTLLNHQVSWLVPILGLSVLAAAFAYVTGIAAARRLGAKLGSFVALAEVLFATAFAWVLLHQVPTTTQFLGGALILAGVVLVRLDES